MANITAAMVKELRETSGAGMLDCKKALVESDGDIEAAIDWLRQKGLSKAAKKSSRVAAEGLVAFAVDGTTGSAIELNAETDFVSRNETFQQVVGRSCDPVAQGWRRYRRAAGHGLPRHRPQRCR